MSNLFRSPEVRVVEASAGSGKTYALARRYVQLLLLTALRTPQSLKHILAITFSNKAVGEMKGRIIGLLKAIALGEMAAGQEEDILGPLGLDAKHAQALAERLMQDVIRYYHFFQVQTIDSFMKTLLAGCAFKIDLSAKFKIKHNFGDYLQLSLDELIDASFGDQDIRALFEAFIRQYLFLENRGGWFPKKDLLKVLTVLFKQNSTYHLPLVRFNLPGSDTIEHKKHFLRLLKEMQGMLPPDTNKKFAGPLAKFIEQHPVGFDIDDVSKYFTHEQFPINKGGKVSKSLESLWADVRKLLRLICLQEAYAVFDPYVDLFNETMACFTRLQVREDILFLQQLNQKTAKLFDDDLVTVEELYYRLATRFNHYLIDEFQDTSQAQWNNLRMMVEESLSTGGTLFYVGDKKQAIYSFRGGQSALFDQLQDHFEEYAEHEVLSKNWRSHKCIVDFNNRIFSLGNLRHFLEQMQGQKVLKDNDIAFTDEDFEKMEQVFASGQQTSRTDRAQGVVRVEIVAGKKKEERLSVIREKVLAWLKDVRGRFPLGDIAVLTRSNDEVEMVTQWLAQEGIAVQSERTSDVKSHPLVQELVSFLKFLHSPVDNIAFAEFLLGRLFPKVSGIPSVEFQQFLFDCRCLKASQGEVYFYKRFRDIYPELWRDYFDDFFALAGIYPLYELAVSVCGRLHPVGSFPQAQGFIMHFLELIKRREEESCDLESFLEYFEALEDDERFVPMPAQDAVHVQTVHKSKGLEFPVVIIPFLEMSIKFGSGGKETGLSFIWDVDEKGMHLLRLKKPYTYFCPELAERYAYEYKQAVFTELNTVYVALTRAVWEMYVLIPERAGSGVNPAPLLVPTEAFVLGAPAMPMLESEVVVACRNLEAVSYQSWTAKLQEEFLHENAFQRTARAYGDMVHFCLSQLGNLSEANGSQAIEEAVRRTKERFVNALDGVQLRALVESAGWREFFFLPAGAQVLCEQEIVNPFGGTRRIDRLVILPREIWVADFKTSRIDAATHARQLEEYQGLLSKLYPDKAITGRLLYINE